MAQINFKQMFLLNLVRNILTEFLTLAQKPHPPLPHELQIGCGGLFNVYHLNANREEFWPLTVPQSWTELWARSPQYACSPQIWLGDSWREDCDSERSVTMSRAVTRPAVAYVSRNPAVLDACKRKRDRQGSLMVNAWASDLEAWVRVLAWSVCRVLWCNTSLHSRVLNRYRDQSGKPDEIIGKGEGGVWICDQLASPHGVAVIVVTSCYQAKTRES